MIAENFVLGKIAPDARPNFGKNIILIGIALNL